MTRFELRHHQSTASNPQKFPSPIFFLHNLAHDARAPIRKAARRPFFLPAPRVAGVARGGQRNADPKRLARSSPGRSSSAPRDARNRIRKPADQLSDRGGKGPSGSHNRLPRPLLWL
jgi:hypothetical protein